LSGEGGRSDFVQSLERGLSVIRAFGPDHRELTLAEVSRATSLTRASARRFLLTLMDLGYVNFNGRTFSLGPRVLELGYAYLSTLSLNEVAAPHMESLVAAVRESSSIAVLDGDDITYVVRVPTKRIMTVTIAVGTRFPAYATSMGRVLLAHLTPEELDAYLARVRLEPLTAHTVTDREVLRRLLGEVASQRFAVVDQELEDGLRSIAVPIDPPRGQPRAAINVSVHASRMTLEGLGRQVLPQLRETAALISSDLQAIDAAAGSPVGRRPPPAVLAR
jgi:IclR family pca regulon transcriptional regulator